MIRFTLKCACETVFEGWFRCSDDYENQLQSGFVECPQCGGQEVTKALMAPNVTGTKRNRQAVFEGAAQEAVRQRNAQKDAKEKAEAASSRNDLGRQAPATTPSSSGEDGAANPDQMPSAALTAAHMPPQMAGAAQMKQVVEALRELKKRVTAEATYVGAEFAEEARKMHFGEAELRAIYGEATLKDAKELLEEGIEIAPLPMLPEDHN